MMIQASSGQPAMSCDRRSTSTSSSSAWILGRIEALGEPVVASGQDLGGRSSNLTRQHGNVCRRALRSHPGDSRFLGRPLLGQRRLPVARACHQQAHLRARAVEGPDQPRPLEDASSPQSRLRETRHVVDG